jgi:hypothetical protein
MGIFLLGELAVGAVRTHCAASISHPQVITGKGKPAIGNYEESHELFVI